MVQTYTDNCFVSSRGVLIDAAMFEENFAALKSAFSGTVTPSNTVAGMWWLDTTNHILKHRNEANTAWLSVWDMANNKPIIANLSNEITVAMMAAATKDPVASTAGLRSLGTTSVKACAGNDSRLSDQRTPSDLSVTVGKIAPSAVSQAKLKTTTGSVSVVVQADESALTGSLPGGSYGFRLQVYASRTTIFFTGLRLACPAAYASPGAYFSVVGSGGNCYAQERYVQSSGEVHWIFYLKNRSTGIIESSWQAPDHCCFGNGDDPSVFQQPFGDYDEDKYELVVVNPPLEFANGIKSKAGKSCDFLQVLESEYEIDELSSPAWSTVPVTVGLPGDWEEAWLDGKSVKTIKAVPPKPKNAVTRVLKKRAVTGRQI